MKKFIYVAVLTATGIMVVSCDADSVERVVSESKMKSVYHESPSMTLKETDTISIIDTLTTNLGDPGPGDDVIPIKPPKP